MRNPLRAGTTRGWRGGRAAVPAGQLRPRGQEASDRRGVAGDRARAGVGRHVPVPADRARHEPGTDRLHDGPQPVNQGRSPRRAEPAARAVREQALRVEFFDVGAVVYFLRKVLWTVPGFTVDGFREQLARMHEHIRAHGPFVSHAQRFLIEARKPRNVHDREDFHAESP